MTIKELIEELKKFDQTAKVLVSSDEELNILFQDFEVAVLGEDDDFIKQVVIYGLSGSEVPETYGEED
jgi:predicted glycosyltransferase